MYQLLVKYNASQTMPTLYSSHDTDWSGANPALYGGYWSSWKDVEPDEDKDTEPGFLSTEPEYDEEMLVVMDSDRGWSAMRGWNVEWSGTVLSSIVVLMIMAGLVVKVLYGLWARRWGYKVIGDGVEAV